MLVGNIGSLTPSSLLAVIWLSTSLALVFVLLRALCRWHISQRISVDDALVYFASALLLSMAVLYTLVTPTMFTLDAISLGKQEPGPTFMGDAAFYLKCQFAIICLFWTTLWAVKVSILMFYKNLFNRLPKQMTLWWWVLGVVVVLYLGCWGSQLASCVPISGYFVIGQCNSPRNVQASNDSLYITTGFDMASDILVMMPLLCLLPGLRINRKEKVALTSIFSLSAIVIIVAIIRVIQTSATTQHVDPVWLALWSSIESSVAVMVSCLPCFRVLLAKRFQSSGGYVHKPSTNGSTPRERFSPAIRLDPIYQHQRGFSDVETLNRDSGEHYFTATADHESDRRPTSLISAKKVASQTSIPKGNIRVRNEFIMTSEAALMTDPKGADAV